MAISTTIDPEWKFQVNQVDRVLKKYGADSVTIYKHPPEYPQGYIIVYIHKDSIWQVAGQSLPHLTETIARKLKDIDKK